MSNDLKINIKTTADTAGAKEAADSLDKVKQETKESGDATEKYAQALGKGEKAGEKFSLSHREIRHITRDLIKNFPELGEIVTKFADPWVGLTLAITAVVAKMVEYSTELRAMTDRPGPDWEADTKKIEDMRRAYEDTTVTIAAFSREMDRLLEKPRTPQEDSQQHIAVLQQQAKAETDILSKQHEREQAGIEAAESLGLVNHTAAVAAKLALDEDYTRRRLELEDRIAQSEIHAHKLELDKNEFNAHVYSERIPGQTTAAGKAHADEKRNDDAIENTKTNLQKALEERKTLQESIAETGLLAQHGDSATVGMGLAKSLGFSVLTAKDALKLLETRYSGNEGTIANLQKELHAHQDAAPELKDDANKAEEELNETKEALKTVNARIHELRTMIPESEATAGRDSQNRRAVAGIETQTSAVKAGLTIMGDPGAMADAEAGANALTFGRKITQNQGNEIGALAKLLENVHLTQKQSIDLIASAHQNQAGQQSLISSLQRSVTQLSREIQQANDRESNGRVWLGTGH